MNKEELRCEFESTEVIKNLLSSCDLSFDGDDYFVAVPDSFECDPNECFINGAWMLFQELKK